MREIVLDTETTGLDPAQGDRLIEIGCIEIEGRRKLGAHFHVYIQPQRPVSPEAQAVHGITDQFLKDKPLFRDIAPEFLRFVDGATLIIHNAAFDIGFLNHELALLGGDYLPINSYCKVIDTLDMARKRHPGQRNSLDALCKRYDIDNSKRELHGALLDAEILAQLYLAMRGGQAQLFEERVEHTTEMKKTRQALPTAARLASDKVIYASDAELALHETYLKALDKQAEQTCLWSVLNEETL